MTDVERRDLLEVLEDRYGKHSTVLTSQLPTQTWHEALGEPTIADAICDRLVHNAHVLTLRGGSIRRQKGLKPQPDPSPSPDIPPRSSLRSDSDRIHRTDDRILPERMIGYAGIRIAEAKSCGLLAHRISGREL